ncbi:hemolysin III family protein [Arsenicitalea aurantiaca]|uniref:Hemolysin III family protein n=1 Tax=Arsenicitalea aurantiaca TaxID=1783274 RepID=A0A433XEU8_9HYPH|nr:hemolysin III family protein [Arsenicitalea aurantiaca]RUT32592.1 hemolysin III family protein [Arsenicitalea aurantiaca]
MDTPTPHSAHPTHRSWWHRGRAYTLAETIADGIVHGVGLLVALVAGSLLIYFAAAHTAPEAVPALAFYVGSLVVLLSVSLAFNLAPISRLKMHLARFDQAAIFLFMAGSYTPFLAILGGTTGGRLMMVLVWGSALIGIALKLIVPQRFGRVAILLYLAIGWSGILVFQALAETLPASTLWLLLAGGIVYSLGIIFHLWERMPFQNALWHVFVVIGASLHLLAVFDCMVLRRL